MPTVRCKICDKEFYAKPFWIKQGYGNCCSTKCQYEARKTGKMVACSICGKETYKQKKQLKRSKSGSFFCDKICQAKWRNKIFSGSSHGNWVDGKSTYRRILKQSKIPEICLLCETDDIRVLAVHHIDKDRTNNALSNLIWLCHNCHFLIHHDKAELSRFSKKYAKVMKSGLSR